MAKKVRLADIADKVGVSVVTVSKALSGQKGVSEEMRERICALARELGYRQPSVERREAERKSFHLGVIIHEGYLDKYASFYWQMYQNVSRTLMEEGSFCFLEILDEDTELDPVIPKLVSEQKVDGLIFVGTISEDYLAYVSENVKLPQIYIDFTDKDHRTDAVISDSFYGAYHVTNYLFDMGHTRIAYVGTVLTTGSITDRYLGYLKSLMEHGVQVREDWVIPDREKASGHIDPEGLKLPDEMPTAFFCNCDLTASMVIKRLQKMGYRVPEDISVAGYDNYIYPGLCDVEITSYEVDMAEMARVAVDVILKKIAGESYRHGVHIVEGHLVIKESVARVTEGQSL